MKKKILIVVLALIIIGVCWGYYLYKLPRTDLTNIKPSASLDAISLYNQFNQDETEANKKYSDKVLEVKGIIGDIQHTDSTLIVELKAIPSGGINCSLAHYNKEMSLPDTGTFIVLKGKCTGYLVDVNMVDCVIVK